MKTRHIGYTIVVIFISALLLSFIAVQTGCDKMKGTYTVVGFPQSFADLVEKVKPAVVNISTTSTVKNTGQPFQTFFRS